MTSHFPDRRGSGANQRDRGHTPSARRLIQDLVDWLEAIRNEQPGSTNRRGGISWGGKLVVIAAARKPELVDAIALICPGLHPRVGVTRRERLQIAWAFLTNRHKNVSRSRCPTRRFSPPTLRAKHSSPPTR